MTRRSFFGSAAGAAAGVAAGSGVLALLGARPAAAVSARDGRHPLRPLEDYFGRLCYNENPLGPSPLAIAAIQEQAPLGHRYTDWMAESLRGDLADYHGVSFSQVIAGAGGTEMLRLAALAFADPAGNVVCPYPSYGQFDSDSAFLGAEVRHVDLDANHRIDLAAMAAVIDADTTAVCITNPNNPTATVLPAADIAAFVDALPPKVVVVIDEAYHDYVHDPAYASAIDLVSQGKNVVVIRTFSKVFGMAGIRVGYAVGKSMLLGEMSRWQFWGTVSRPSLEAARAALGDAQHMSDTIALNDQAKQYCFTAFGSLGLAYIPSETNFFMVDVGRPAGEVAAALAERGIYVRTGWGMPQHLRVSTGTMTEMQTFIAALGEILGQGVEDQRPPRASVLEGNYPNPFRARTEIAYRLASAGPARIQFFDAQGRVVATPIDGHHPAGVHRVVWEARDDGGTALAPGIYYYRLTAGDFVQTRRLICLR